MTCVEARRNGQCGLENLLKNNKFESQLNYKRSQESYPEYNVLILFINNVQNSGNRLKKC